MKQQLESARVRAGRSSRFAAAALTVAGLPWMVAVASAQMQPPPSAWIEARDRAIERAAPSQKPPMRGAGSLQLFPDLGAFQSATAAMAMNFEDFSSRAQNWAGPCFEPINSRMGQPGTNFLELTCFRQDWLIPGFNVRSEIGNGPGFVWFFGGQTNGVGLNLVGTANSQAQATHIDFDDGPIAIALDAADWMAGTTLSFIVYGTDGRVLGDFELTPPAPPVPVFAGFISPVPVQRVEIRSLSGAAQMFGNLRFGGQAGGYVAAQSKVAFGPVALADTGEVEVELLHSGDLPTTVPSLPAPPAPFGVLADSCSDQVLMVGASCTIRYGYSPGLERADRATVDLPATNGSAEAVLSLRGRGVAPTLGRDREVLAFGEVAVGDSASAEVTLRNPVAVPLQVVAIEAPQAPFHVVSVSDACPSPPFVLAPGQTCRLGYELVPTGNGVHTARVLVQSDDPSSPWRLLLQGVTGDEIFADGFD